MKKKFDLSAFIAHNWWYYVLWLVLVVVGFEAVFSFLTRPKDEESVYFFCGVEGARTDDIYADLEKIKPEYVKNIEVYAVSSRIDSFDSLFITRGQTSADIYVLPDSYCQENFMQAYFYPMDMTQIKAIFGEDADAGLTVYDGVAYGVKIYDAKTSEAKGPAYFTYTYVGEDGEKHSVGDYYIFFNKKSMHLGELTGSSLDGAVRLAQAVYNGKAE